MTSIHHRTTSQRHKGKTKQLDPIDALAQLNLLLEALLIPIALPDISVVTSSLLLAVVESILERRFLALDDSTRTSRSPQSRSNCLRIILKVLNKYLHPVEDDWSSEGVSLTKLVQGDTHEVVQLIDGLVKLSKQSIFSHHHKDTSQNPIRPEGSKKHRLQLPSDSSASNVSRLPRAPSKYNPTSRQSTVSSSLSSLSYEPSRIPLDGLFPPVEHRFDESSCPLPSRVGSTTSSISPLARSLNRSQQQDDVPLTEQLSNPPTLRNLLGPLQAQMSSSKRPQSPRTAHRVMVNKLRSEGVADEIRDQILSHDADASLSTNIEHGEQDNSLEEESPYQYPKGASMMTLDGIEPDDPFVSMETRRAMESQLVQNQTNATFDFTQWAVTGGESFGRSVQLDSNPLGHAQPKQPSTSRHNNWSRSSSSAISNFSANSHHTNELAGLSDGGINEQCQEDFHSDVETILETLSNPKNRSYDLIHSNSASTHDESSFSDEQIANGTDLGFGQPTRKPSSSHSNDYQLSINPLAPSRIPLPPSPSPSIHEHKQTRNDHKVLFASQGGQLNLIVADVIQYERDKEKEAEKMQPCDWSDVEKISQNLQSISSSTSIHVNTTHQKSTSSTKLNLISKKLELLKLLNQAYNNNNQTTIQSQDPLDQHQVSNEETEDINNERSHHDHQELERVIEKENGQRNVRIRVARQPLDTSYATTYGSALDDKNKDGNNVNRFIVLNRFNLLQHPASSCSLSRTSNSSTRSVSSCADSNLEQKLNPKPSFDPNLALLRGDLMLDDVI